MLLHFCCCRCSAAGNQKTRTGFEQIISVWAILLLQTKTFIDVETRQAALLLLIHVRGESLIMIRFARLWRGRIDCFFFAFAQRNCLSIATCRSLPSTGECFLAAMIVVIASGFSFIVSIYYSSRSWARKERKRTRRRRRKTWRFFLHHSLSLDRTVYFPSFSFDLLNWTMISQIQYVEQCRASKEKSLFLYTELLFSFSWHDRFILRCFSLHEYARGELPD